MPAVATPAVRTRAWFADRLAHRHPAAPALAVAVAGYALVTPLLLVAGWLLTGPDAVADAVAAVDPPVARWVADRRRVALDPAATGAAALTDTRTVVGLCAGAGAVLVALRRWRELTLLAVAVLLELAAYGSVAFTIPRARPDVAAADLPVTGSFPSGHAAMAVVLYGGMAATVRSLAPDRTQHRPAVAFTVAIALAVGLARLYQGLHYPTDVVAGWALGAACLAVAVVAAGPAPPGAGRVSGRSDR